MSYPIYIIKLAHINACSLKLLSSRDTIINIIHVVQNDTKSSFLDELLGNGITILLALLAALVALYQVKSNIVSTARIKWIEELRQEISELYDDSLSTILYWMIYTESEEDADIDNASYYQKYDQAHSKFNVNANKIRMKLNLKEEEHRNLDDLINEIDRMLDSEEIDEQDQAIIEVKLKEMVVVSRKIFKKEWDRSKRLFRI